MFGAGPDVFALWGYVIAHAVDAAVELNPPHLAATLGTTPERIVTAINYLTQVDPHSRNPQQEGRRLVHENGFQYRVISHDIYRKIRSEDERRAYNREAQKKSRAKRRKESTVVNTDVNDSQKMSKPVNVGQQMSALSAHTEAEADTEAELSNSKVLANSNARANTTSNGNGSARANDLEQRAGRLLQELYPAWYTKHRKGATLRLMASPLLFQDAISLCKTWDDARLEKLAHIVLTTNDEWVERTDRSFKIFVARAQWAEDRLRQVEAARSA